MLWIITVLGIPVARAVTLGVMGRKLIKIRKRLRARGFTAVIPEPLRTRFTNVEQDPKEIRVFVMDNDRLIDILTYEV